jgi:hypothetical protein
MFYSTLMGVLCFMDINKEEEEARDGSEEEEDKS